MISKEQESQAITEQFEKREAGVADLFEFYARVEAVYITASQTLAEGHSATTTDVTNPE